MRNKFILTCDCGCGDGLEFNTFPGDLVYVSCFSSLFHTYQLHPLYELRRHFKHLNKRCFFDIVVSHENMILLYDYLTTVDISDDTVDNELELVVSAEFMKPSTGEIAFYTITLEGKPKLSTFFFKHHRLYDIQLNKTLCDRLCDQMRSIMISC